MLHESTEFRRAKFRALFTGWCALKLFHMSTAPPAPPEPEEKESEIFSIVAQNYCSQICSFENFFGGCLILRVVRGDPQKMEYFRSHSVGRHPDIMGRHSQPQMTSGYNTGYIHSHPDDQHSFPDKRLEAPVEGAAPQQGPKGPPLGPLPVPGLPRGREEALRIANSSPPLK